MHREHTPPSLSGRDLIALIGALNAARQWSIKFGACHPYGSESHTKCYALTKAVDSVGTELTGDPEYYRTRWASYPSSSPRS